MLSTRHPGTQWSESLAGVVRRAERFHVSQVLRSASRLFVCDEGSATDEEHWYAPIRPLLLGVPGGVPVHTGNVCHHVDLHRLTPQLQDAAWLKHILSCDLFRRKAELLERRQSSLYVIQRWMDQDVEVTGESRRAVEGHRSRPRSGSQRHARSTTSRDL